MVFTLILLSAYTYLVQPIIDDQSLHLLILKSIRCLIVADDYCRALLLQKLKKERKHRICSDFLLQRHILKVSGPGFCDIGLKVR